MMNKMSVSHGSNSSSVPFSYKNVFVLECFLLDLSNSNKLSSMCKRQVRGLVVPSDSFKDVISVFIKYVFHTHSLSSLVRTEGKMYLKKD